MAYTGRRPGPSQSALYESGGALENHDGLVVDINGKIAQGAVTALSTTLAGKLNTNGDGSQLTGINTNPTMGGDLSGTASNAQIVAGAVGSAEIADSAVTDAKISSMSSSKLSGALPAIDGSNLTGIDAATVSSTTPASPAVGDMWFDTTSGTTAMKVWSGTKWDQMSNKFSASGGTESISSGYKYHTFTSSGTFTTEASVSVDVLVAAGGGAGGGAGGTDGSGGGGAGGLVYASNIQLASNTFTVIVGAGGAGIGSAIPGNYGSNSSFPGATTAIGGGGGGSEGPTPARNGRAGGSGGGGGGYVGIGGSGTSGQGYAGGSCTSPGDGGGGGAGGSGAHGSSRHGGVGLQYSQFSTVAGTPSGWFAGGGSHTSSTTSDNIADSTNNYLGFTNVQLEVGDTATDFEHRDFASELTKCQRYYELRNYTNVSDETIMTAGTLTGITGRGAIEYIEKRVTPSISFSAGSSFELIDQAFSARTGSAVSAVQVGKYAGLMSLTVSGATTGAGYLRRSGTTSPCFIEIDAEL